MSIVTAITKFCNTGECELDLDKAVKCWNLLCRIYKYNGDFTLVEFTLKGKRKVKFKISVVDAELLINELHLTGVQDSIFAHGKVYLNIG